MPKKGRKLRPLFTIGCLGFGAWAGYLVACKYFAIVGKGMPEIWIPAAHYTESDKMWLKVAFAVIGALMGFVIERLAFQQINVSRAKWLKMAPRERIFVFTGIPLGLLLTVLIRYTVSTPDQPLPNWATVSLAIVLCYVSVVALESVKEQANFYFPDRSPSSATGDGRSYRPKLLDTNVIIDGRIADVCRAGFVEGTIFVPKFIIEELQQIADSSDSLKRARGRRGLEILTQMQKEMDLQVPDMLEEESADEVDARLVRLAKQVDGAIITNDYNLNKVAGLQGVDVLNVNELANALKPVVLPGEEMRVTIIKEGKEKEQGIGYLDDGTMIVVEGGRRRLDQTLQVNVTSVLQTVQGKMIFAKIREDGDQSGGNGNESGGPYSSGRFRRKSR
jgi:uncharacterized protein YacL